MKKLLVILGVVLVLAGFGAWFGPTEHVDETVRFEDSFIGTDVETYLAKSEERVANIIPGAQKQVIWANPATREKTPVSLVYIHGFSATLEETRPLPDLIARELGANLFYTRLTGHGAGSEAMATATVNDWFNDTAEALAIGRMLGEKVVVISASTGGTFASWAATRPTLSRDVAGLVMISPNYGLNNPAASVLTMGFGRDWIPMVFGAERSFEPSSPEHAKWWTTKYPTVSLLPMAASVEHVNTLRFEEIEIPALFIYHPEDGVVRADITADIAARWGQSTAAEATVFEVEESEDPLNHVIAGRILSPSNSEPLAGVAADWIKALE